MNQDNITVWDNSKVFKSIDDPEINKTLELAMVDIKKIQEKVSSSLDIVLIQEMLKEHDRLMIELATVTSYAHSTYSVDTANESAQALMPKVSQVYSELTMALVPVMNFLQKI